MTIRKIVSRSIQDGAISTTDISSSDLSIDAGTLYIDSVNNRVGVGTTTPSGKLDVNGDASISGLTVGKGGGSISTNTAIGLQAFGSNISGSQNTAIGNAALISNTSSSSNTAVGFQAGYNYAGSVGRNTLIGYQAGYSGTGAGTNTSYGSTFLGYQAGYAVNSSGSFTSIYNTFVGDSAGVSMTTGSNNTILGRFSGNQGGLDIRTSSNYIVLSDGDGNPRAYWDGNGVERMPTGSSQVTNLVFGKAQIGNNSNYWRIGKWVIAQAAQSERIKIRMIGESPYGVHQFGESHIIGSIDNSSNLSFCYYSQIPAAGESSITVYAKYETDGYAFYVRSSVYATLGSLVDVSSGYWIADAGSTGSDSPPASSYTDQSYLAYGFAGNSAGVAFNQYGVGLGTTLPSSGLGVRFPATQSASSDANTLDDYEEGTFTPIVNSDGGNFNATYGWYTKIGRVVNVIINVNYSATAGTTNVLRSIQGLPFQSAYPGPTFAATAGLLYGMQSTNGTTIYPGFVIPSNTSLIQLYLGQYNATEGYMKFNSTGSYFSVNATYYV